MDLEHFKNTLLKLQSELLKRYNDLNNQKNTSASDRPSDIMDLASDAFDDDLAASLTEREAIEFSKIREALRRIDEGKFGTCAECNSGIGSERLDALPFATLCIKCKQEMEQSGS